MIKPIRAALTALLGAAGASVACHAAPPKEYTESSAAYKTEVTREDAPVVNARFTGDVATSQAKRSARPDGQAEADLAEAQGRNVTRRGRVVGQGVDIASPQIFGTVRGDVTIVVDRNLAGGSITSVRR